MVSKVPRLSYVPLYPYTSTPLIQYSTHTKILFLLKKIIEQA